MLTAAVLLGGSACGDTAEPRGEAGKRPAGGWDERGEHGARSAPPPPRRRDGPGTPSGRQARVTEVIGGDTVEMTRLGRVRLIGVDTPERGACYEDAATRFTRRRIGGRAVRYELGAERNDRYGRVLAYLYRGGRMHNLALVRDGYAGVLTIAPNDTYAPRFERAELRARRRARGRWGACRRAPGAPSAPGGSPVRPRPRPSGPAAVPPPPPDLDCSALSGPVDPGPGDPHDLDADGDGVGCDG